jgi:hypothetical protein
MTWTHDRPTKPGLYWYRPDEHSKPEEYEALKIGYDDRQHELSISPRDAGAAPVDSCGEWYGPVRPPSHDAGEWDSADSKPNVRIIVRLRHGGSFYVENVIPNGAARLLSTKLKSLREHGDSIPAHLRVKMSDMVHELMTFAKTSSESES